MNSQLIQSNISIIDYDGGKWLTAEQLLRQHAER